ncbi:MULTISPECIES: CRISPR-associated endonuclease Cas2 [Caproicibacterium]|uniref:CRISPR-associated endoribonuclease Cas2 n=1 Tax=Caproicibacterium argilliputei TaxID=3030016 RepID=A0AA97H1Y9_9FIRM|nr:CRISPR-associated endonuclease Cas2 [Caproicibacterium argilliputei]WOC32938.1 CRISPR-associated endonuclease Cas2 [Caproicibacterium argilliputei]
MLVLVTYDVNTTDDAGKKRLRRVAKECVKHGQRVQCSVFECLLDASQCKTLQAALCRIIDLSKDSLRFYYIGNHYHTKIEHFGVKAGYDPEGTLIF